MTIEMSAARQDLYQAVNGEWIKQATIPADKPTTGGFSDLVDDIEKTLMADLDGMINTPPTDAKLSQAVRLYALAKDFARRESEGTAPLKARLRELTALTGYQDAQSKLATWLLEGDAAPLSLEIEADMKQATTNALFAGAPGLILPDKTYYAKDNPQGPQLLARWKQMVAKLLAKLDYPGDQASRLIDRAVAFDARMVPYVKSREEAADYSKMYNPQDWATFVGATDQLDLAAVLDQVLPTRPRKVIVTEPAYYAHLNDLLSGHFADFKAWLIVNRVTSEAGLLSDDLRILAGEFGRALSGSKEAVNQQKFAYRLTSGVFSQVIGNYYAKQYFGATAKHDVEHMVHQMIAVYKKRLTANTWLSPGPPDRG